MKEDKKTRMIISIWAVLCLVLVGEIVGLITGLYPTEFTAKRVFVDIMLSLGFLLGLTITAIFVMGIPLLGYYLIKK